MESIRRVKIQSRLIKFGNFIGDMLILQIYFILYTLRGAILLGIFPAFLAVIKCLIAKMYETSPDEMKYDFKKTYHENFEIANKVGLPAVLLFVLLIWEYRYNQSVINNGLLSIMLTIIIAAMLVLLSHLPITILRFDLEYKDYFSQALLIAMASPFELISIILSLFLIEYLFAQWLILPMFFFAPILAAPFAWFSYHSVEKIIKKREEID